MHLPDFANLRCERGLNRAGINEGIHDLPLLTLLGELAERFAVQVHQVRLNHNLHENACCSRGRPSKRDPEELSKTSCATVCPLDTFPSGVGRANAQRGTPPTDLTGCFALCRCRLLSKQLLLLVDVLSRTLNPCINDSVDFSGAAVGVR